MIWLVALLAGACVLVYRWLAGGGVAAVLMIPFAWWIIWLVAYPIDMTGLDWFFSIGCALVVAALPRWIREESRGVGFGLHRRVD